MRLNSTEYHAITSIIKQTDAGAALYLFGSRADDRRKGGDIDLFLELTHPLNLRDQLKLQQRLMDACESKIDLLVKNPQQNEAPFFKLARQGIRL